MEKAALYENSGFAVQSFQNVSIDHVCKKFGHIFLLLLVPDSCKTSLQRFLVCG